VREAPVTERPAKGRGAKERKGPAKALRASAQAPAEPGRRERRRGRNARRGSPLAQVLSRLEQLRPPSTADLVTALTLVFICLVVGIVFWMYNGTPTPW
jgi:hypothetical protein